MSLGNKGKGIGGFFAYFKSKISTIVPPSFWKWADNIAGANWGDNSGSEKWGDNL